MTPCAGNRLKSLAIGLLVGVTGLPAAADEAVRVSPAFEVCQACHGVNGEGRSDSGAPRLAGQHREYLMAQLEKFRDGRRGAQAADALGRQMASVASALPDADALHRVAEAASTLVASEPGDGIDAGDATRGAAHFAMCAACHGARGEGQPGLGAPRLAGQHGWYLVRQLEGFRAGLRGYHAGDSTGQVMRGIAQTLPDTQAIHDVVAYVLSLR